MLARNIGCCLTLMMTLAPAVCRAERDIVYSARYYTPPSSRAVSRWHLYRINPDGTGREQLTRGAFHHLTPLWSPDGRKIVFVRMKPDNESESPASEKRSLCLLDLRSRRITALMELPEYASLNYRWSPDGRTIAIPPFSFSEKPSVLLLEVASGKVRRIEGAQSAVWSPDGSRLYIASRTGGGRIVFTRDGKETPVSARLRHPLWLNNRTLAGYLPPEKEGEAPALQMLGADGKAQRVVSLRLATPPDPEEDPFARGVTGLLPVPGDPDAAICVVNNHDSTVGILYRFYRCDLKTGVMKEIAVGQFICWSPDRSQFCTAPGRALGPYGRRPDGTERTVWVAPLQIGSAKTGKLRVITKGAVWTLDADWRR